MKVKSRRGWLGTLHAYPLLVWDHKRITPGGGVRPGPSRTAPRYPHALAQSPIKPLAAKEFASCPAAAVCHDGTGQEEKASATFIALHDRPQPRPRDGVANWHKWHGTLDKTLYSNWLCDVSHLCQLAQVAKRRRPHCQAARWFGGNLRIQSIT